jgi:hypothetical protein
MINTNLLDVNFQNKFAFSTEQYFEGKMFEQNYTNYEDIPYKEKNNNELIIKEGSGDEDVDENINLIVSKEKITLDVNKTFDNHEILENHGNGKEDFFRSPEKISKNKDNKEGEKKRRSRFDQ